MVFKSCFPAIVSPISVYMSNKETIWYENPNYDTKYTFFSYLGGPEGPLRRTHGNENFRAVRTHHRADICITRGKNNNCQFFIYMYGPQYTQICIFGYSGGPWVAFKWSDRVHLASQLYSHIYQSTYQIWKQSDKGFLSYCVNDEMRTRRTQTRRRNDD